MKQSDFKNVEDYLKAFIERWGQSALTKKVEGRIRASFPNK